MIPLAGRNNEVLQNVDGVLEVIHSAILGTPTPDPFLPQVGGGENHAAITGPSPQGRSRPSRPNA
jgi:hypothetical protein